MINFHLFHSIKKNTIQFLLLLILIACNKEDDVLAVESWELSTESLGVGFEDESNSFNIINTGTVAINYSIIDKNDILKFDRNNGELSAHDTVKINFTASNKAMNTIEEFEVNLKVNDSSVLLPAYASKVNNLKKTKLSGNVVHAIKSQSNKMYIAFADRVEVYQGLEVVDNYDVDNNVTAIAVDETQDKLVVGSGEKDDINVSVYNLSDKKLVEKYKIPWYYDANSSYSNIKIQDVQIVGDDFIYLSPSLSVYHGMYIDRKETKVEEDKGYLLDGEMLFMDPFNDGWIFTGNLVTFINYKYRKIQAYTSWNVSFDSGTTISDEGKIFLKYGLVLQAIPGVESLNEIGKIEFPYDVHNGRATSLSADCNIAQNNVLYFRGQLYSLFPYNLDVFNYTTLNHKYSLAVNAYQDEYFYFDKKGAFIFSDQDSNKAYLILQKGKNTWYMNSFTLI